MKYYLIAGEASGDLHASNLMKAIRTIDAEAQFRFFGGEKMLAQGGTLVRHYRELAYMGFISVALHLPTILAGMRQCKRDIIGWKPDCLILVDYPGFNLNIAHYVHTHTHVPVFYYISPKIWAWKERRIKNIRRDVDHLLTILPFETDYYSRKHNYEVHYVGNPCVDAIDQYRRQAATDDQTARHNVTQIALLAGSRKSEIKSNLPRMLAAAAHFPDHRIVIAGAPNIDAAFYHHLMPDDCRAEVRFSQTYDILAHSQAALVTSGTATLETAILRIPQVVCFHMRFGPIVRLLRRLFLRVPYFSLVNLILQRPAVTELLADEMNPDNITRLLRELLADGPRRQAMLDDYDKLAQQLGPTGASTRAARYIIGHTPYSPTKNQQTS